MGVASIGYSKIDCEIQGHGNVATISVSFDDEDCLTADFEYTHTFNDGTSDTGTNTEANGPWSEIDFSTWDCCEPA